LKFQDRREAAIEDCSCAIELKPDYVKALVRRGQAYEDLDRPHEAMKDFEKVLEIDPGLKEAKIAAMVNIFQEGNIYVFLVSYFQDRPRVRYPAL
jgi:tetratricopeptide (TPR) repeat protein